MADQHAGPYISVVAPCYNEAAGLEQFHARVRAVLDGLNRSAEIILVDDGSSDETWEVMTRLVDRDGQLRLVKLSRNHGHQLALSAGLSLSRGERILVIDADLQDPPEALPEMLALMDAEGADVVYGQRRHRNGETAFKKTSASLFYRIINRLSDTNIPVDTGDFRLISRRALDVLNAMPEKHRFIRGMVSWIGFRQVPYLYDRDARFAGETKYPLAKMVRLATDAVTSFSTKPLRLAMILGFLIALVGVGMLVYVLGSLLFWQVVPGWASQLAAIAILGSMQLFVLGVMGWYLGRLYEQSQGRPLFVIEEVRDADTPPGSASPGEPDHE